MYILKKTKNGKKCMKRKIALVLSMLMLLSVVVFAGGCGKSDGDDSSKKKKTSETSLSNGDTIEFGSYPQTEVTDSSLVSTLTNKAGSTDNWTSYNYYIEDEQSDFMRYTDVEYNGEKYRGVYFDSYRPGYTVYLSSADESRQDDNGYNTGTVYWFKYEPVTWTILDADTGLVISKLVLDSQEYYDNGYNRTKDGNTVYPNNWEYSNIRSWLNDDFYNTAFTKTEKKKINTTTLENKAWDTVDSEYDANDTEDKVFALTYDDAFNHWNSYKDRRAENTDYAKCQGVYDNTSYGTSSYWLRSAGYGNNNACYVNYDGDVSYYYYVGTIIGIRPALCLNLSSSIY